MEEKKIMAPRGKFPGYLSDGVLGPCTQGHFWMPCRNPEEVDKDMKCPACARHDSGASSTGRHVETMEEAI